MGGFQSKTKGSRTSLSSPKSPKSSGPTQTLTTQKDRSLKTAKSPSSSLVRLSDTQSFSKKDNKTTAPDVKKQKPLQGILKKPSKGKKKKEKGKKKAELKAGPETERKTEAPLKAIPIPAADLTARSIERRSSSRRSRQSNKSKMSQKSATKSQTDPSIPRKDSKKHRSKKKPLETKGDKTVSVPSSISLSPPLSSSCEDPYPVVVFKERFAAAKRDFMNREQKGLPPKEVLKGIDSGDNYFGGVPNNEALRVAERRHFERGLVKSRVDDEQDTIYET